MESIRDPAYAPFPLWLELSGLPAHLNETAKVPFAWAVFHKVVELDMETNVTRPGMIEITPAELAERCGLDDKKLLKALKGIRKAGLARMFLPDHEEEVALLQILTPIPTPKDADRVRAEHPSLFLDTQWPPRYAVAAEEPDPAKAESREEKVKRVVELYFDVFSMRMNSLILDQVQLIADRYDEALIRKVFERAKKRETRSIGWILTEIRREMKIRKEAEEVTKRRAEFRSG